MTEKYRRCRAAVLHEHGARYRRRALLPSGWYAPPHAIDATRRLAELDPSCSTAKLWSQARTQKAGAFLAGDGVMQMVRSLPRM